MHRRLLALLLFIVAGQASVYPVNAQGNEAEWLLSQINALRQSKGVPLLAYNAQLAAAANGHSTYLSGRAYTSPHIEENGSTPASRALAAGYPGKLVGENVAGGSNADAKWAFNWWLNSPIHFQNMLGDWQEIGIGVAQGESGQWYTLLFGSQAAGVIEPASPVLPANSAAAPTSPANAPAPAKKAVAAVSTRKPTRVPTATPTITRTPTITYTPRATFTPTSTSTRMPPTPTAIELEVSPQPTSGAVAVAMVTTPGAGVTGITQSSTTSTPTTTGNDGIRRLLPWLFLIQGSVVVGFVGRAVMRRYRRI